MNRTNKVPVRIMKELERLEKDPEKGIVVKVINDDIRYLDVNLTGPAGTPFENGVFKLELYLPDEYPLVAPKVRFITKIYHPNIDGLGRICLDILKDRWTPALQIRSVLLSIQALLSSPNPEDPLDQSVATHWKTNKKDAENVAKEWTKIHAKN